MLRKITTLATLTMIVCSCGKPGELITFPPGEYISDCFVEGSDSKRTELDIERDFKSQTSQTFVYPGVVDCSGERTAETEPVTSDVSIVFSNVDLGNNFSYLTTVFEKEGQETKSFIAFRFENSKLYFSSAVTSLGDDPKKTFANFIAEPDFTADLIFTKKDLNRRLSRN